MKTPRIVVAVALVAVSLIPVIVRAHEMTYQGTVMAVESARVQVKVVDATSHKEQPIWFVVDKTTKIKRGTITVAYADAGITNNERVVVIVNHDAEIRMLATEIRLAARK